MRVWPGSAENNQPDGIIENTLIQSCPINAVQVENNEPDRIIQPGYISPVDTNTVAVAPHDERNRAEDIFL